jgi:hypothetical protein
VGANEIVAPYWGFFSTGHFAGHERKFGQDFKDIFSELYREFESRLVRQQVIDRDNCCAGNSRDIPGG